MSREKQAWSPTDPKIGNMLRATEFAAGWGLSDRRRPAVFSTLVAYVLRFIDALRPQTHTDLTARPHGESHPVRQATILTHFSRVNQILLEHDVFDRTASCNPDADAGRTTARGSNIPPGLKVVLR
jgi:hypothetical protein